MDPSELIDAALAECGASRVSLWAAEPALWDGQRDARSVSGNPFEPPVERGPEEQDTEAWRVSHQQMVLQDQWDVVVQFAQDNEDVFAGQWWDNTTDPVTIVLALTDVEASVADEARRAAPYPAQLRVVTARRSIAELEEIRRELEPEVLRAGLGIGVDPTRNAVVLILSTPDPEVEARVRGHWADAVAFDYAEFGYAPRNVPE